MSRRGTSGFTLLELVVVLAIFAVVALAGTQVIRTTVVADRRLAEVSAAAEDLSVALALLRRDMRAAVGIGFVTPAGGSEPPLRIGSDGFSLSVSGLDGVQGGGLGRVIWRHDPATGRLLRRVWITLTPGAATAAGPEVAVLDRVTGISVDSHTSGAGWRSGYTPDPRTPDALPHGLRVRLDHAGQGRLETLVALR